MRTLLITAALLLAACSPAPTEEAPVSAATTAEAQAPANSDTAALGATPQTGSWTLRIDEGTTAAGFGVPESEYQLVIGCQAGGNITVIAEHELSPDQNTTLRIITAVQTIDLPARSFNEGLPTVTAEVTQDAAAKTPLIGMLGAPTDRFAVDIAGQITVFPWDEAVAQALTACR
ncbi:MAG: hypothetical protein R3C27_11295 [Hyphomonadaceae bacterium]